MSTDINIGALSEALNSKLDIGCMNSNSTTANGLNTNGIRTLVEVSDKSLLPSYYRVYSDGWCEQGGIITIPSFTTNTNFTITFLKNFLNTNYTVYTQLSGLSVSNWAMVQGAMIGTRTNNNVLIYLYSTSGNSSIAEHQRIWKAEGYIS